jgi:hypothetical protein
MLFMFRNIHEAEKKHKQNFITSLVRRTIALSYFNILQIKFAITFITKASCIKTVNAFILSSKLNKKYVNFINLIYSK